MKQHVIYHDLGRVDYKQCWDLQEQILDETVRQKVENRTLAEEDKHAPRHFFLFCEHPHVFTLGKSGEAHHLLANESVLKAREATFYKINRGGDITYHGPGQVVVYPIINLNHYKLGVKRYVHLLEQVVIDLLKMYDITAERLPGATGVWVQKEKICAIGIKCSGGITMHGLALNVTTDLEYFKLIHPCGFIDKGVTSMLLQCKHPVSVSEVKKALMQLFKDALNI